MRVLSLGLLVCVAALVVACPAAGAPPDAAKIQARAEFSSMSEWQRFVSLPDLDIMKSKPGVGVTFVTDAEELAELRSQGHRIVVEIEDMEQYYASRIRGPNFGQYHTYSETEEFLDDLHAQYPSITTARDSIGTTIEGRTIWAIKISDNPDLDESEPEILFDGMHHAREPMSLEVQLHFMEWLTQGYGTDPEATFLVDNREIWFVPILNVDGYVYNETTFPSGGGMWRKNRRDNAGTCEGVDINRNYPYQWGGVGSSSDPCSETYRGTAAGSEPEIQAYMNFIASRNFVANISFHSVAGLVLIPWSYTNTHTADDATFRLIGNKLAESNGYTVGQAGEVLYNCSGTTTDWLYAAHDIWATCIEVSGSDFWPLESEIDGLNAENLWPQIYLTRITGLYVALADNALTGGNANGKPDPGETLDLTVSVENQSLLASATNVTMTLTTDDAYVQLVNAASTIGTIAPSSTASNAADPFVFTVDPSTPGGHAIAVTVRIDADGFSMEEELVWIAGTPYTLFSDNMESGISKWSESDGRWGLTTASYSSPTNSYTDSPTGSYVNSVNTWIQTVNPIDLSNAVAADLAFNQRYKTEVGYDFCYVEASTDGGATWSQVGPPYSGDSGGWGAESLSLSGFCGTASFKLRFRFASDSYITDDGWYVDDVVVLGPAPGNARPTAPTLSSPPDGGSVSSAAPILTVANATDADPGDVLTYGFVVYADEPCTVVAASTSGVAEGGGTTGWQVAPALADGEYWWRAYADDGTERGPLMASGSFTLDTSGVPGDGQSALALHPARPNPFASETALGFDLPTRAAVAFTIHSVDGRLVRALMTGEAGPGPVEVVWDGRDERGERVASGLYFVRLEVGNAVRQAKVVVLK
jgi:carboxypeptidase T